MEREEPRRFQRWCSRVLSEGAISEANVAELLGISTRELNRMMDELLELEPAFGRKMTGREVLLATSLGSRETVPFALACAEFQMRSGNVSVPYRG